MKLDSVRAKYRTLTLLVIYSLRPWKITLEHNSISHCGPKGSEAHFKVQSCCFIIIRTEIFGFHILYENQKVGIFIKSRFTALSMVRRV